ncbi:MAG: hypothetical protein LYZ69_00525 [Nitrososphaerales archaeon]|nr:hypothetical protein [Nitrososphaerales archaeon]
MPRHVFVHKFKPDGVFCPWVEDKVSISRCLRCPMNATHELTRLDEDDVRGKGYIECNYTGDVSDRPPDFLTKK